MGAKPFSGDVARSYAERLAGPCFRPFARELGTRLNSSGPILEVAAGSGVLAEWLPAGAICTDRSKDMVHHANRGEQAWIVADFCHLPFQAGSFETLVNAFGIMFADPREVLTETHRVLRPGGEVLLLIWSDLARQDFNSRAHAWRPFFDAPFQYANLEVIRADLEATRFAVFELETWTFDVEFESAEAAAEAYIGANAAVRNELGDKFGVGVLELQRVFGELGSAPCVGSATAHFVRAKRRT